ncbi:MAG: hypothetical protein IK121_03145 [Lachnospiraceae bacterium]|nr:hypothetical protein [Lachnospiraceae bacterium]
MKEKMKKEAEARLSMLDLHPDVLNLFKKEGKLYYSERTPLGGILYWLDNKPDWVKLVKDVEEEMDILVYTATHEYTSFGECLCLLYVSSDEDSWEYDREDLDVKGEKYPMAFVLNLSEPAFSEFGSIGIIERGGGLIRTA